MLYIIPIGCCKIVSSSIVEHKIKSLLQMALDKTQSSIDDEVFLHLPLCSYLFRTTASIKRMYMEYKYSWNCNFTANIRL